MVAGHHEDLNTGFFEYLSHQVGAANGDEVRQEALVALATRLAALCEAFDKAQDNEPALEAAVANFNELLTVSFSCSGKFSHIAQPSRHAAALIICCGCAGAPGCFQHGC